MNYMMATSHDTDEDVTTYVIRMMRRKPLQSPTKVGDDLGEPHRNVRWCWPL